MKIVIILCVLIPFKEILLLLRLATFRVCVTFFLIVREKGDSAGFLKNTWLSYATFQYHI